MKNLYYHLKKLINTNLIKIEKIMLFNVNYLQTKIYT